MQGQIFCILVILSTCAAEMIREKRAPQNPLVFDALKLLRGKDISQAEITSLLLKAVPGVDYPDLTEIPEKEVDCKDYAQSGFYADVEEPSRCQVFYRCDSEGNVFKFLCPAKNVFNQITLLCDWFYNVDCSKSKQFENYANSRLEADGENLFDDVLQIVEQTKAVKTDQWDWKNKSWKKESKKG